MKKIVKGNDFTLKIPVMKMVEGQAKAFPLPACTDVVVQVCNQFKRIPLAFEIDVKEDNVLLACGRMRRLVSVGVLGANGCNSSYLSATRKLFGR